MRRLGRHQPGQLIQGYAPECGGGVAVHPQQELCLEAGARRQGKDVIKFLVTLLTQPKAAAKAALFSGES